MFFCFHFFSGSLFIRRLFCCFIFIFITHSYIPFQQTIKKGAVGKLEFLKHTKKKGFGVKGVNEERKGERVKAVELESREE